MIPELGAGSVARSGARPVVTGSTSVPSRAADSAALAVPAARGTTCRRGRGDGPAGLAAAFTGNIAAFGAARTSGWDAAEAVVRARR